MGFSSALMLLSVHAALAPASARLVEEVIIEGNARTRDETILELLPRRPPAHYTERELIEFERRVNNLAVFDEVTVTPRGSELWVILREKWTLIPSVEFASGETLEDSSALLGVTEFNFLGTANQLGFAVSRAQRGWGATVSFNEHTYRRRGWSWSAEFTYSTAVARFEDGSGWHVALAGGSAGLTSPPWLSDHLVYRVGVWGERETISDVVGPVTSPDGYTAGTLMSFIWDDYQWHDLVPSGFGAALTLGTGFIATDQLDPHDTAELLVNFAAPLGRGSVLVGRSGSSAVTRGNANSADWLGSVDGVRGLRDGYYRTWLCSYANLELRQSLPIAARWALQGVLFSDAAVFEQLTATGDRGASGRALAVGAGVRLIPTWLAGVLLRVDGSRLVLPDQTWFVQVGLGQYF